MDYKEKYQEAKNWIESIYPELSHELQMQAEAFFPEIAESKDEKIRKQILNFLKEFEYDHYRNLNFSSWIAWLEKQGIEKEINSIDVFIDKAEKFLYEKLNNGDMECGDIEVFINDFKNYIKGNTL